MKSTCRPNADDLAQLYEREFDTKFTTLTAEKRKRPLSEGCDFSAEWNHAKRHALARVRDAAVPVASTPVLGPPRGPRRRGAGRPAMARRRASTSRDDGDSEGGEPGEAGLTTVHIVGVPSADSDATLARHFERFLSRQRPGTTWTVDRKAAA